MRCGLIISRPRILQDMEHFLTKFMKRQQLNGVPMSKQSVKLRASSLHRRLLSTGIYNVIGERHCTLKDLGPSMLQDLLYDDGSEKESAFACLFCPRKYSLAAALIAHLSNCHVATGGSSGRSHTI